MIGRNLEAVRVLTMPPDLTKAHQALDCLYRNTPFASDKDRLELLFERYRELTTPRVRA